MNWSATNWKRSAWPCRQSAVNPVGKGPEPFRPPRTEEEDIQMRFKYGMPPAVNCTFKEKNILVRNYQKLHVIGLLWGLILSLALFAGWRTLWDNSVIFGTFDQPPEIFIPLLISIIFLHEIVHVMTHPKFGLSSQSIIGILPKSFMAYSAYLGEQSRNRIIVSALAPFVALTIIPFLLSSLFSRETAPYLAGLSILNGMGSAGDLIILHRILRHTPGNAIFHGEYYGFR
ncbi:DUF3267 domain-containing protein [Dyella sp. EPa41]|uniref:DUF3267 domain-containing protein n=1 Tax=Dyella sp. EPa41 TaxID=1561194 RepID=UPI0019160BD3|nr:DUF3267 domain-containing protein [Dyella sp. EPa41]